MIVALILALILLAVTWALVVAFVAKSERNRGNRPW